VVLVWEDEDEDRHLRDLSEAENTDQLCRLLLESPGRWGSSGRGGEAAELLARVRGTGPFPDAFCALLLCTCRRWERVTAKVIAAIEASGLLTASDLDELAESFLGEDVTVNYSIAWLSPDWLTPEWLKELADEVGLRKIADDAAGTDHRAVAPPLRRWAASRTLRGDPQRLDDLLAVADAFPPYPRDAMLQGLLDAAASLEEPQQRQLVRRGLRSGQGRVRLAALGWLREMDGTDAARRRARSDPDATVRKWKPPSQAPPG
jgi:hypothetical protein